MKLKSVKSHNKCRTTSTLFTNSLPLLLYCLFVYPFPIFQKGFFLTVKSVKPCFVACAYYVLIYLFFDIIFLKILLINSGDTDTNPGSRKPPIKLCLWNLNGLAAHEFIKVPLIKAFISTHNFDNLCLSETFFDSTIHFNDEM